MRMISQTRRLSTPSAINRSPTRALMVCFLSATVPAPRRTVRVLPSSPSSPPAPPGYWGRGHQLAGRSGRRDGTGMAHPPGVARGRGRAAHHDTRGRGGGLVMRAVDPRLLRHAGAARGYLAVVVLLGLTVTALVL